jgi:hypothetical protein
MLARHLKLASSDDVRLLSATTLGIAVKELELSSADRAAIDVWLRSAPASETAPFASRTDNSQTTALADAVERQRLSRMFPWLAAEEAALRQSQRFHRDWVADKAAAVLSLQQDFEAKAKNATLGPLESLVGQYCLYCPDPAYGSYLLMCLLLRLPVASRVPTHNWLLANDMPRGAKEAYGSAIAALTVPLFPQVAGLLAANTRLLEDALGGTNPSGGGLLHIGQVDGSWFADSTPLEQQIEGLYQQINALKRQRPPRSQPPPQPQTQLQSRPPAPQPARQQQRAPPPYAAPTTTAPPRQRQRATGGAPDADPIFDTLFPPAAPPPSGAKEPTRQPGF